jgi:hypothetical protein
LEISREYIPLIRITLSLLSIEAIDSLNGDDSAPARQQRSAVCALIAQAIEDAAKSVTKRDKRCDRFRTWSSWTAKTLGKSMVGVTGFEPATSTSQT